jgi:outer membrane protein OmpA-like peptidoglycan-associated protein
MKYSICVLFFLIPFTIFSQQQEKITVYFGFNKFNLDTLSQKKIRDAILHKNISGISIEAHCDSVGSDRYNDALSMSRAMQVKKYIISENIQEGLIDVKGFGKKIPLNNNETENDRALNRRAEILFTSVSGLTGDSSESISDTLSKQNSGSIPQSPDLDIEHAEIGSTIRLENINFYGGRHIWLPRSESTLKKLLKTMQDNPNLEIEIQGHICCLPSGDGPDFDEPDLPMTLSVNRAKAIYNYLVNNGIDKSRLSYKGFGSDFKLIRPERTEYDRQSNRRVEIKILRK